MKFQLRKSDKKNVDSCHGPDGEDIEGLPQIVLVGNPNVGKSLLFNRLTGAYVVVSNYPGTTVTIDTGKFKVDGIEYALIDSPGMYSLISITEEERIGKRLLLEENPRLIIHVIDAKNMERMLPLSIQLIECGLPVIVVMNMMDEAKKRGIVIDFECLREQLGVPVVPMVAATGKGIKELKKEISEYVAS